MKNCPFCGKENSDDSDFCGYCGQEFKDISKLKTVGEQQAVESGQFKTPQLDLPIVVGDQFLHPAPAPPEELSPSRQPTGPLPEVSGEIEETPTIRHGIRWAWKELTQRQPAILPTEESPSHRITERIAAVFREFDWFWKLPTRRQEAIQPVEHPELAHQIPTAEEIEERPTILTPLLKLFDFVTRRTRTARARSIQREVTQDIRTMPMRRPGEPQALQLPPRTAKHFIRDNLFGVLAICIIILVILGVVLYFVFIPK